MRNVGLRKLDERGSGLVEYIWVGLGLIVPLVCLVITIFDVQRGAFAVESAARAAVRAYALAPSDAAGDVRARDAAASALADQGVDETPVVTVSCVPYPSQCHSGTSTVTVTVRTQVNVLGIPSFLGGGSVHMSLDATESAPIGRFQAIG